MAETAIERLDRQMAELKAKRRAAIKREREKERRQEKRRRQLIGDICMEHGDEALMAQIYALVKEHVPVADIPLWSDLFPEQAPEVVAAKPQTKTPSNRGEQALADLKATARQHAGARPDDQEQFYQALRAVREGFRFVRIHRVREQLGWPDDQFNAALEALRAAYVIELHGGNPSQLTPAELAASYQDAHGEMFITLSWREL